MSGILAEGQTTQCVPLNIELHDGIDEINAFVMCVQNRCRVFGYKHKYAWSECTYNSQS